MSRRMKGYREAAGLDTKKRRGLRKDTLWDIVKRAFSYERNTGIVDLSTIPFITERWVNGERQVSAFLVSLPQWVSEEKVLEAINDGFGFLLEEGQKKIA